MTSTPDEMRRLVQDELDAQRARDRQERQDWWARAGVLAAWCLVALGVFSGVVLLLTLVTR